MNLIRSEALVRQLEESPERVRLSHGELETMITTLTEDIYQLSLAGTDNDRKMRPVVLECQARLVLEASARTESSGI